MEPGTVDIRGVSLGPDLNKELSEIKQSLEQIKFVLGIGKVTPATVIQIKRQVAEKVRKTLEKEERKGG